MNDIFELFDKYGATDYIGEDVTQTQHMVQAAEIANEIGMDPEFILAALFHDIGHLLEIQNRECKRENSGMMMGDFGRIDHEKIGEDYLRKLGFSERVCRLSGMHVMSKRYLVTKDPKYRSNLSSASQTTLMYQGSILSDIEMEEFESDPLFEDALKIRHCDDLAKDPDNLNVDLDKYKKLIEELYL
jgi:putative nucleotidyltransferase with HDIG domain